MQLRNNFTIATIESVSSAVGIPQLLWLRIRAEAERSVENLHFGLIDYPTRGGSSIERWSSPNDESDSRNVSMLESTTSILDRLSHRWGLRNSAVAGFQVLVVVCPKEAVSELIPW